MALTLASLCRVQKKLGGIELRKNAAAFSRLFDDLIAAQSDPYFLPGFKPFHFLPNAFLRKLSVERTSINSPRDKN